MEEVFEGEDMVDELNIDDPQHEDGLVEGLEIENPELELFDMVRFTELIESNQMLMGKLQVGPDPMSVLEMRLKSAILQIGGEALLLNVEMMVQEWLAEGLLEAETEMNRQKLLEGVNQHPANNVMPMPNIRVQGDM